MPVFPPIGGGGGGVDSVEFPLAGFGTSPDPLTVGDGLNPHVRYVSPTGNNSHSGLTWQTAMATLAAAYDDLYPNGGEIHFADNSGGPLWVRGDGWNLTGWRQQMPFKLVGHGRSTSGSFGYAPCAKLTGASPTDREVPLLWFALCVGSPISLENIQPDATVSAPFRAGWDYHRNPDGTMALRNITSWARVTPGGGPPGVATVTVQHQAAVSVLTASRDVNDIVTLTYADPFPAYNPWPAYITLTSTDAHFPSGTYQVIDRAGASCTYLDVNAYHSTGTNIGSWTSHGINAFDNIEVQSTSVEVPSTVYKVTAVTATTITVTDYYGYSDVVNTRTPTITVSNPGTYVLQDRQRYSVSQIDWNNVQGAISEIEVYDRLTYGPTFDLGATADGRLRLLNSALSGDLSQQVKDPIRYSWFYADAGSSGNSTGLELRFARPSGTGGLIYGTSNASWGMIVRDWQGDLPVGSPIQYPTFAVMNPNTAGFMDFERVSTADAEAGVEPFPGFEGMDPGQVRMISCGANSAIGNIDGIQSSSTWGTAIVDSPYKARQVCWWADQRVAGKTPASTRPSGGLMSARYKNEIQNDASTWTLSSITATPGFADPFGGTNAINLTVSGFQFAQLSPDHGDTTVVTGLRWVFGCWVKRTGGLVSGANGSVLTMQYIPDNPPFLPFQPAPFFGDGDWQFLVCSDTVTTVTDSGAHCHGYIYIKDQLTVYNPVIHHVPAGEMTDNEFAEYVSTLRQQAYYLKAGYSGTQAGTKFIAHGGLGTAARYDVGVSTGQITLGAATGKAVELFDEDGNSLGVVAPLSFTVN